MTNRYDNLQALYEAARPKEEPSRADERAVRTAMMSAGIAAVTFHASSAAGKLLALAPGGAKLFTLGQLVTSAAIGVAIGGGVVVAGIAVQRGTASITAGASSVHPAPVTRHETVTPISQTWQPEATLQAELPPQPSVAKSPTAARARSIQEPRTAPIASVESTESPAPPAQEGAAEPRAQSLMDESRGLAEVQFALGSGNVSRALQLLDQQDVVFRGGSLTQERAAARVIALCTAHRTDATNAKERFMAAYPGSPLVRRVIAACKNR